ncbi:MAG: hypothetical protein LPJ89_04105 [Hymenobacteraceae bacterium]|nr:hypothetical protein [Hymenobacteraceae bacterium]MDX5395808.1 hypothetical protein [Hymenobacteraceae bacterium]MDX5442947.1 hypothetical protein [Hymenobacteraceae bacterium]MDX5511863.1 hypothetical protein [Hymenobacteraceae bacterium]
MLQSLDISKSTFQEIASTREQLVTLCIESAILNKKALASAIVEKSDSATEAILTLLNTAWEDIKDIQVIFLDDLAEHYPEACDKLNEFVSDYCFKSLQELFYKGIQSGEFHPELDAQVITGLFMAQVAAVLNPVLFPDKNDRQHAFQMAFLIFMRGITSTQGQQLLEQHEDTLATGSL